MNSAYRPFPRFLPAGDTAVVVEFGETIDRGVSDQVLRLSARVRASKTRGILETVPTYRSLMVLHDPLETDAASVIDAIQGMLDADGTESLQGRTWRIPACYDTAFAPDLAEVAERTGRSEREVVRAHADALYHVYMIGFVPGFPYMGDLPQALDLPRRTDPRVKVPAGSIAIAGRMTAVYPVESPGGWHLIGATPVRLFDLAAEQPALLRPGDKVRFEPVDAAAFERIKGQVAAGSYRVSCDAGAA